MEKFMKLKEVNNDYGHYFLDENGLKQGENKEYYSDGQLWLHSYYKDGKLHGEYKVYNKNGQLWIHYFYKEDIKHGECKRYSPDGSLDYTEYWSNGKDITDMYNKLNVWKKL